MSEIRIDGKLLTESIIDGENVTEVLIDGCSITFEKSGATPWFYISGGSGSYNVDFTGSEYNEIIIAGIRFKGANHVTTTRNTALGSQTTIGTTSSGDYICAMPSKPSVPTPPWGCSHSGATGWSVQVCGILPSDAPSGASYCVLPGYVSSETCSTANNCFEHWGYTTNSSAATGCVRSATGHLVGGTTRVRTRYSRTCVSAMNDGNASGVITYIDVNGGATKLSPLFTANKDTLRPTSSSANLTIAHDDTTHYLFELGQFIAGNNNTINFQGIRGTGNVHAQLVYVYR